MCKSVVCDLIKIFMCGVSAVLPNNLIRNSLKYNPATQSLFVHKDTYEIREKKLYVIGTGKAVQSMARETEIILDQKIEKGIISIPVKSLQKLANSKLQYHEGAKNNLPDLQAEIAAQQIFQLASGLHEEDLLIVLISGGGSALLPLPKEPITLDEKTALIKTLANSGADITELNVVRKKISSIKGGKLAFAAYPAQVISLVLSDIVGDPLDLIASGPTVENKDDSGKAKEIVQKYISFDELPNSISHILNENDDTKPWPNNVKNYIIGSNKLSISGAVDEIEKLDYFPVVLSNTVTGNVQVIAEEYFKITLIFCDILSNKNHQGVSLSEIKLPGLNLTAVNEFKNVMATEGICLVFGGETTVEVKGKGKGGRNQQLALEFAKIMNENKNKLENFEVSLLSAGTDGIDGPTDAAGAISYKDLVEDAKEQNLNVQNYLDNNDSYSFYKVFKNGSFHVVTGHTGTNVMDLQLILIKKINH